MPLISPQCGYCTANTSHCQAYRRSPTYKLFGVLPEDETLQALENCPELETLRVSKYRKSETDRFYRVTKLLDSFAPSPGIHNWI